MITLREVKIAVVGWASGVVFAAFIYNTPLSWLTVISNIIQISVVIMITLLIFTVILNVILQQLKRTSSK